MAKFTPENDPAFAAALAQKRAARIAASETDGAPPEIQMPPAAAVEITDPATAATHRLAEAISVTLVGKGPMPVDEAAAAIRTILGSDVTGVQHARGQLLNVCHEGAGMFQTNGALVWHRDTPPDTTPDDVASLAAAHRARIAGAETEMHRVLRLVHAAGLSPSQAIEIVEPAVEAAGRSFEDADALLDKLKCRDELAQHAAPIEQLDAKSQKASRALDRLFDKKNKAVDKIDEEIRIAKRESGELANALRAAKAASTELFELDATLEPVLDIKITDDDVAGLRKQLGRDDNMNASENTVDGTQ